MHRKILVGSVAALALAVPASASATGKGGKCSAADRSQVQCASQNAPTNQAAVAKSRDFGISDAANGSVTMQVVKQKQRRGLTLGLILR